MVDIRRGFPPAVGWLGGLSERPGLPGLVLMELVEGCRDARDVQALMRAIAPFRLYWLTDAHQERAIDTYTRAHLSHGLGLLAALIGECAVGFSAVLCTFNVRHYQAVPGQRRSQQ